MMKRDNGALLALGVVGLLTAAGELSRRRRGGRNEEVEAQLLVGQGMVPYSPPRRQAAAQLQRDGEAQRRAELEMSDQELANRTWRGGDVLGGMSFEEAVRVDPRRIGGLVAQELFPILKDFAASLIARADQAYGDIRRNYGSTSAYALVDTDVSNDALRQLLRIKYGRNKPALREDWPVLQEALKGADEVCRRAAMVSVRDEDRHAWSRYRDYFRDALDQLDEMLAATPRLGGGYAPRGYLS
jgi:5-carboxymethyl-2-hydroxymuconate isomerase